MERFKYKNNLKFFTQGVFQKKGFKTYTGLDIINLLENNLRVLNTTDLPDHKVKIYNRDWHKKDVQIIPGAQKKLVDIVYIEDYKFYENPNHQDANWISLDYREGWKQKHHFGATLNSEHYIRGMKNIFLYNYILIPGEFICKYMTRIIAKTDYQKFVHAMKEYKSNKINKLIQIYEKYDKVYNDVIEEIKGDGRVNKTYSWRRDLFFYMTFTLKKLGYFNPVVDTNYTKLFFDGSHRLGVGSAVGYDVPIFTRVTSSNIIDNKLWLITCGYFDNRAAIFGVSNEDRKIYGYWVKEEDMKNHFKVNRGPEQILLFAEQTISFSEFINKYSSLEPDFIFHE